MEEDKSMIEKAWDVTKKAVVDAYNNYQFDRKKKELVNLSKYEDELTDRASKKTVREVEQQKAQEMYKYVKKA